MDNDNASRSDIPLLNAFPEPVFGWSPASYLDQVKTQNGFTSIEMLSNKVSRKPMELVFGLEAPADLHKLTGHSLESLLAVTYAPQADSPANLHFLGHRLDRALIQLNPHRLCPICAAERNHFALFDLILAVDCPMHECRLLSACPDCSEPFDWREGLQEFCSCGAMFTAVGFLKPVETAVAKFLASGKGSGLDEVVAWSAHPFLDRLSLAARIELIQFLTAFEMRTHQQLTNATLLAMSLEDRTRVMRRVAGYLLDWPDALTVGFDFLAGAARRMPRTPAELGLFRWRFSVELTEVSKLVEDVLGTSSRKLERSLIPPPAINRDADRPRASPMLLVTKEEAGTILTLPPQFVVNLAEEGFLTAQTAPGKLEGRQWRFSHDELRSVLSAIQDEGNAAPKDRGDGGILLPNLVRAANMVGISKAGALLAVAHGKVRWLVRSAVPDAAEGLVLSELDMYELFKTACKDVRRPVTAAYLADIMRLKKPTVEVLLHGQHFGRNVTRAVNEKLPVSMFEVLNQCALFVELSPLALVAGARRAQLLKQLTEVLVLPVVGPQTGAKDIVYWRTDILRAAAKLQGQLS